MSYKLFFVIFFILYGAMHFYVFLKAKSAFSFGALVSIFVCLFLVLMTLAPWLVRMSERTGLEGLHVGFAYISYIWMATILIFFITGICTDIFRLILYVSGVLFGRNVSSITSANFIYFIMCLGVTFLVIVYGFFEAQNIKTEHIVINTKKITAEAGKVRIAQISDVHLGVIVGEKRLRRIITAVQQAKPDILVSTGDLLDGQPDKVDLYIDQLNEIDTPLGKYAVSGNHEAYLDSAHKNGISKKLSQKAGFRLLGQDYPVHILPGLITLTGVDDHAGGGFRKGDNTREKELCSKNDPSQFTVLLKHRPVPYYGPSCAFDLQLSGHTHKGQIFPFHLLTRLFFKYYEGLYELSNKTHLYVSRGSGTWGPPIRFLTPPEVTIIDIVHKPH